MIPDEDNIFVSLAETDSELRSACELRFQVFSIEYNDYRYADPDSGVYVDSWDNPDSKILIAKNDRGHVVGTLRYFARRSGAYAADEAYHYEILADILDATTEWVIEHAALISRGAVAKGYRGQGVFSTLLDSFERICRTENTPLIIGAVNEGNDRSMKLLLRHGYRYYGTSINRDEWEGDYIYKFIDGWHPKQIYDSPYQSRRT